MIRAAPGLYPVREILAPDTLAAFWALAGPYGFSEDDTGASTLFLDLTWRRQLGRPRRPRR
jgi:hypothetical protein